MAGVTGRADRTCNRCNKVFQFPCRLATHLARKTPCAAPGPWFAAQEPRPVNTLSVPLQLRDTLLWRQVPASEIVALRESLAPMDGSVIRFARILQLSVAFLYSYDHVGRIAITPGEGGRQFELTQGEWHDALFHLRAALARL